MPGFDGTGPRGEGPMTGRGLGNCRISPNTGKVTAPKSRSRIPRGRGRGRGPRRSLIRSSETSTSKPISQKDLREEVKDLRNELKDIKEKLSRLLEK